MRSRKALIAILLAAGMVGSAAIPVSSMAAVDVQLNFGPPPPRYEAVPPPRSGYVWAPGYWGWDGHRHIWHTGHWERARPGYAYRQPHWVEHNGRWTYQASRWDRDGDGIANRRDPTPDGPRYADRDRDGIPDYRDPTPNGPRSANNDRDGDGVPNRYDARPDNPYRR